MEDDGMVTKNVAFLSTEDYIVFTALLAVSTFIGLFFAWVDSRKRQKDSDSMEDDYLIGSRSVGALTPPPYYNLAIRQNTNSSK